MASDDAPDQTVGMTDVEIRLYDHLRSLQRAGWMKGASARACVLANRGDRWRLDEDSDDKHTDCADEAGEKQSRSVLVVQHAARRRIGLRMSRSAAAPPAACLPLPLRSWLQPGADEELEKKDTRAACKLAAPQETSLVRAPDVRSWADVVKTTNYCNTGAKSATVPGWMILAKKRQIGSRGARSRPCGG